MSRLRVFMYHKVSTGKKDFLTVDSEDFSHQMAFIKSRFNVVRLSQVLKAMKNGESLPSRPALITFDDGYMNNYELAYPILKSMNLPFTVFLVSKYIGRQTIHDSEMQSFMGISELKAMQDLAEYGYHGLGHENLMDMDGSVWEAYVGKTKESFADLGLQVQPCWAYTYGAYPGKSKIKLKLLRQIFETQGILCAMRIGNRINSWPLKHPFKIQRMDIRGHQPMWKFRLKAWLGKISI